MGEQFFLSKLRRGAPGSGLPKKSSGMHEAGQGWERGRLVRTRCKGVISTYRVPQRFSHFALSADGTSALPAIDCLVLTLVAAG